MMKTILMLGPLPKPFHGQSFSFLKSIESLGTYNKIIINTNLDGRNIALKIPIYLFTLIRGSLALLFGRYDLVYLSFSRSKKGIIKDFIFISVAKIRKKRILCHLHGSDFKDLFLDDSIFKHLVKFFFSQVDGGIVLSEKMKDQFEYIPNVNLHTLQNFITPHKFMMEKKIFSKQLIFLSNIMVSKGILELVDAFKEFSKLFGDYSLVIVGDFLSDKYASKQQVKKIFLEKIKDEKKIIYTGPKYGLEKDKLLFNSDIWILPSMREAFPLSALEAMYFKNFIMLTDNNYLIHELKSNQYYKLKGSSAKNILDGLVWIHNNQAAVQDSWELNHNYAKDFNFKRYTSELNSIIASYIK